MFLFNRICLILFALGGVSSLLGNDQPSTAEIHFFESKIRPVLAENCYRCHSAKEKIRGGLVLDTRAGLLGGGDSGDVIVPGDAEASLLWKAVSWAHEDYQMPPKEKLSESAIQDLREWIQMGAPDPRRTVEPPVSRKMDIDAVRDFWSFQSPQQTPLPPVKDQSWPRQDMDYFVLAKLEAKQLRPARDAKPEIILRRLNSDLIGLPPSPEEVAAFLKDWHRDAEDAYDRKVNSLLESCQFGERWGRHWLDVARYAESSGKEINTTFPQAWRYRDYVIDAFNADKPYDEFVREQIAGDLLPAEDDSEWQEHLVATGFLAIGPKGLNERDARQFAADLVDEQIDTMSQAVLGLTVSCARCHDHKSDAIPTTDYYALAGIFHNTKTFFGTVNQGNTRRATNLLELPIDDANALRSYSPKEIAGLRARLSKSENELAEVVRERARQRRSGTPDTQNLNRRFQRLRSSTALLRSNLDSIDLKTGTMKALAMGVQEVASVRPTKVLIRGEVDKPGPEIDRGFLSILPHTSTSAKPTAANSGRLELAEWLASPRNPLIARVFVNRVWQHLFGRGLVETPNDFGVSGSLPTHPELLDRLAVEFMEDGWSIKQLIRTLVRSQTYRMSSEFNSGYQAIDPNNELLWRHTPQRLNAEAFRDALLNASGRLDRERPLASQVGNLGDPGFGSRLRRTGDAGASLEYRSVYLPMIRDAVPESLALFDAADPNLVTGTRESTSVPGQALYMMNNPFVIAQSKAFAQRVFKESQEPRERVERAYQIAYGRAPSRQEIRSAQLYLRAFYQASDQGKTRRKFGHGRLAFESFCQSLLASAEFRYIN